jgi:hypothetical protein
VGDSSSRYPEVFSVTTSSIGGNSPLDNIPRAQCHGILVLSARNRHGVLQKRGALSTAPMTTHNTMVLYKDIKDPIRV